MGVADRPHRARHADSSYWRTRRARRRRSRDLAHHGAGLRAMNSGESKLVPRHIHLLGIAGAAMAPVAGMLKERGFHVTGSDVGVYPPASTLLTSLGIPWNEGYREENLKPAPDLAVIGNAISRGNPEVERILDDAIPYCSMPQLLEELFLPGRTSVVVAGTHGKTTTTAMLAWIFKTAGRRPEFRRSQLRARRRGRIHHRRRRIRHGVLRQGPEIPALPSRRTDSYVARIRSRRYLSEFGGHRVGISAARESRPAPWANSDLGRKRRSERSRRQSLLPGRNLRPHAGLRLVRGRYPVA